MVSPPAMAEELLNQDATSGTENQSVVSYATNRQAVLAAILNAVEPATPLILALPGA